MFARWYVYVLVVVLGLVVAGCEVIEDVGELELDDFEAEATGAAEVAGELATEAGEALERLETAAPSATTAGGRTFYVFVEGDDDNDGLSREAAFQTIAYALEVARPGDTVVLRAGVFHEGLELGGIGGDSAPIIVRGETDGVVLDGGGTLALGFWCDGCRNIVVENLEIRNYTDIGIGVALSEGVTLRNLIVHNNGFAVQLVGWEIEGYGIDVDESEGVLVENNDVFENGPNPQTRDLLLGTGINTFRCTDCVIRNNRSYNNIGGGMLVEDGVNVLVEGNEVFGNDLDATADEWWDGALWVDGGHDVTVRGNVFRDNLGPGVQISDEDFQQPYGYVLEDNTIIGNYYGLYVWNMGGPELPEPDVLYLAGNQIAGNMRQDVWVLEWNCEDTEPCD